MGAERTVAHAYDGVAPAATGLVAPSHRCLFYSPACHRFDLFWRGFLPLLFPHLFLQRKGLRSRAVRSGICF